MSAAGRPGTGMSSGLMERGARVGYAASGLLHLLIGWIALQLAWGGRGTGNADQSGAMRTLAANPLGQALLWVVALGLVALGLLSLMRGITDGSGQTGERVKNIGKGVTYLAISWPAFTFATGGSSSSKEQTKDFTADLLDAPGGRILVVLLGLAILGIGGYHVYKGVAKKVLEDLREHPGELVERAGQIGYAAKGAALAVLGGLFVLGGARDSARRTGGLDAALRTLLDQPFGQWLLTLVALGFVAYAVYSFFRAKHARL